MNKTSRFCRNLLLSSSPLSWEELSRSFQDQLSANISRLHEDFVSAERDGEPHALALMRRGGFLWDEPTHPLVPTLETLIDGFKKQMRWHASLGRISSETMIEPVQITSDGRGHYFTTIFGKAFPAEARLMTGSGLLSPLPFTSFLSQGLWPLGQTDSASNSVGVRGHSSAEHDWAHLISFEEHPEYAEALVTSALKAHRIGLEKLPSSYWTRQAYVLEFLVTLSPEHIPRLRQMFHLGTIPVSPQFHVERDGLAHLNSFVVREGWMALLAMGQEVAMNLRPLLTMVGGASRDFIYRKSQWPLTAKLSASWPLFFGTTAAVSDKTTLSNPAGLLDFFQLRHVNQNPFSSWTWRQIQQWEAKPNRDPSTLPTEAQEYLLQLARLMTSVIVFTQLSPQDWVDQSLDAVSPQEQKNTVYAIMCESGLWPRDSVLFRSFCLPPP